MSKRTKELSGIGLAELEAKLVDLRTELAKEKSLAVSGTKSEKPTKIRGLKRDIARALTFIRQKNVQTLKLEKR
ncbi:MAG: 50S ribosomal protein L29 [Candidatus Diapherotrites archaeon]|nr:50S ribosomal protein L29 [Candidatus Diapherotrites archaeon]